MSAPSQLNRATIEQIVRQIVVQQVAGNGQASTGASYKPNLVVSISAPTRIEPRRV